MNNKNYNSLTVLICFAVIFILAGCASPVYDNLQPIPQYSKLKNKFNTSACIQLVPAADERLNQAVFKELAANNYTNVINGHHYMAKEPQTINIIVPLSLSFTTLNCEEGKYLEVRLIMTIRKPGFAWLGQHYADRGRFFQAFSRRFIGQQDPAPADYDEEIKNVTANLFMVEAFRSALAPSRSAADAARISMTPYQMLLQAIRRNNRRDIIRWAFIASEGGDSRADALLAAYTAAGDNICGDKRRLVQIIQRLAKNGLPAAQTRLAQLYKTGESIPKDLSKAFYWFSKAAAQDYSIAQYQVGLCYELGRGTPKNIHLAVYWYEKAALKKYTPAINRLERLRETEF